MKLNVKYFATGLTIFSISRPNNRVAVEQRQLPVPGSVATVADSEEVDEPETLEETTRLTETPSCLNDVLFDCE